MVKQIVQYYAAEDLALYVGRVSWAWSARRRGLRRSDAQRRTAPLSEIDVIVDLGRGAELTCMRWGLRWSASDGEPSPAPTVRIEKLRGRFGEQDGLALRRCLIPVSGFFDEKGGRNDNHAIYFWSEDHRPFVLAGLWDQDESSEACIIVTSRASALLRKEHRETPVVLPPREAEKWLHGGNGEDAFEALTVNRLRVTRVWPAGREDEDGTVRAGMTGGSPQR
jgi:putative SOS response-associated peptidase YedK